MRPARPRDWEHRGAAEIDAARSREWAWGSHDCATFAGRVARAMIGAPTRWDAMLGHHTTALGAARAIGRAGYSSLVDLMDGTAPRVALPRALRFDVAAVLVDRDGEPDPAGAPALGVVQGADVLLAAHPRGLRRLPLSLALAAWAIDPE